MAYDAARGNVSGVRTDVSDPESVEALADELARRADRLAYAQTQVNDIWRTLPRRPERAEDSTDRCTDGRSVS